MKLAVSLPLPPAPQKIPHENNIGIPVYIKLFKRKSANCCIRAILAKS
jgi:hypothetical protein